MIFTRNSSRSGSPIAACALAVAFLLAVPLAIIHAQAPPSLTSSASNNFDYGAYLAQNANSVYNNGPQADGLNYGSDSGGTLFVKDLSPGNSASVLYTPGCDSSCNQTTTFYSNGNGTYNSATIYSGSNMSNSGNSNSSGGTPSTPPPPGCIPVGAAIPVNAAVPVNCTPGPPGTPPIPPSGPPTTPPGPLISIPIANCTSGGKGSTPVCGPSSCRLSNGQTLANGQSTSLFTTPSGQCVLQTYTCANGALTGGVGYQSCSNTAATPAAAVISAISITALPTIVRYGGSSMITWNGGTASSCSVSGPYFSAGGVSGNRLATSILEERTYTLNCIFGGTGGAAGVSKSASVTVRIVPLWREF